jgi:hypothetical protein
MNYGPQKLISDLGQLGFKAELVEVEGNQFAAFKYEVPIGRFAGRPIELGLLALPDFPRTVPSAIHVKSDPQLLEKTDSVPNVRNIQDSPLGAEWRYWSHNFQWTDERTTRRLISQINGIFKDA